MVVSDSGPNSACFWREHKRDSSDFERPAQGRQVGNGVLRRAENVFRCDESAVREGACSLGGSWNWRIQARRLFCEPGRAFVHHATGLGGRPAGDGHRKGREKMTAWRQIWCALALRGLVTGRRPVPPPERASTAFPAPNTMAGAE